MEVKRLAPTKETLIRLFGKSGNQCAFPGCTHEIFQDDILVAQVCHISAAQKGGQRFDETMSNEERRSFENLVILCHKHHKITDDVNTYSVTRLKEMKEIHEKGQSTEIKLSNAQLINAMSDIEKDLSAKMDHLISKVDTVLDKFDFYGRNSLNRSNIPTQADIDLYFNKFLNDETDIAALLLKAQPTIKDCEKIFTGKYAHDVHYFYTVLYKKLLSDTEENKRMSATLESKVLFEYKVLSFDALEERFAHKGITKTDNDIKEMFNKSISLYSISFQEVLNYPGYTLWFWAFIDGRWVFFPKPNKIIKEIVSVRNNKDAKSIAKILKNFAKFRLLPNEFKELSEDEASVIVRQVVRELKKQD